MSNIPAKRNFLYGNALCLSLLSFASYFDVYSHRALFISSDPWWNPAHIILYLGFLILTIIVIKHRKIGDVTINLSILGIVISVSAAAFNEFWHRVLFFGNPLPEPFTVEPPHAVFTAGIIIIGIASLLYPLNNRGLVSDWKTRIAISFLAGSLWLVAAGSAFFIGGVFRSEPAYFLAVATGSFSASLFLAVYHIFFLRLSRALPLGIPLVIVIDYLLTRQERTKGIKLRHLVLIIISLFYGLIYYQILDIRVMLAPILLGASFLGVGLEFLSEDLFVRYQRFCD